MSAKIIATVGYPGSGKTTYAHKYIHQDSSARIVCRDDIRFEMYGAYHGGNIDSKIVREVQLERINLALDKDRTVIVADTNVFKNDVKQLHSIATKRNVDLNFVYFSVDNEILIERNASRVKALPPKALQSFLKNGELPDWTKYENSKVVIESYVPNSSLPDAIIVDLDGTVCAHNRSPYNYDLLHTDTVIPFTKELVLSLHRRHNIILYTSGRPDNYYAQTLNWLYENNLFDDGDQLRMRTAGDDRRDWLIKYEIFNGFYRNNYNVLGAIDDRKQVIDMWRKLGLTVADVAGGTF